MSGGHLEHQPAVMIPSTASPVRVWTGWCLAAWVAFCTAAYLYEMMVGDLRISAPVTATVSHTADATLASSLKQGQTHPAGN